MTAVFNIAADTNWHRFRVYRTSGKINFQIDANPAKTACLAGGGCDMTLPPNPGYGLSSYNTTAALILANDVAAAKTVSVDFLGIKLTGLTR